MQKAFSSPRWRTKVRRAGEKMTYAQKYEKKNKKKSPTELSGAFSLERENVWLG